MNTLACPHCGELTDTAPDIGGGEHQEYVEDCVVCCRPIRFVATYSDETGEFSIEVREV